MAHKYKKFQQSYHDIEDYRTSQINLITRQNEHPLLNTLILEKVLSFCKVHQDNENENSFSNLRLVCKTWDLEVCKFLRPETEIPLYHILSAYPEGLGWTWNRSHKYTDYNYQSPYPDTPAFENIQVNAGACRFIQDFKIVQWFKVMGNQVKSLHYLSPLNCSHQNVLLGNMLSTWCPNLKTLHLSGIQCLSSLLYICEGNSERYREFNGRFNCIKLKNLTISVDSWELGNGFSECYDETANYFLKGRREDLKLVAKCHEYFSSLLNMLPDKQVENENDTTFYRLIENGHIDNLPENFFKEKFNPMFESSDYFPYRMLDWGILGLILRAAPLQKIVVRRLRTWEQCRELTLFLLYQPSKLRSTLRHLEFQDFVVLGRDPFSLKTLSLFRSPLRVLRLDNLIPFGDSMNYLNDLLKCCADTLNVLQVGAAEYALRGGRMPPVFRIPQLPNLKEIVHRNIRMLPLDGNQLLGNCQKLEICRFIGDHEGSLEMRAMSWFCEGLEHCDVVEHPLKELRIDGNLGIGNIEQLGKGLGNLVKVNFFVVGTDELEILLGCMADGWKNVESVGIRMGREFDENKDGDRWNEVLAENMSKVKSLKFLDLYFNLEDINLSVEFFREGIGKLEKLTSLKISNFMVFSDDKEEIENAVAHIPFVLFSQMNVRSRTKLAFIGSHCSIS